MLAFRAWNQRIKSCFASFFCVPLGLSSWNSFAAKLYFLSEGPVSPLEMLTSSSGLLTVSPYAVPQVGTPPSFNFRNHGRSQLESVAVGWSRLTAFCSSFSVLNIFRQAFYFSRAAAHVECQEALCCQDPGSEASRSRSFELQQLFQWPWAYSAQKHGVFHPQVHQTTPFTMLLGQLTFVFIRLCMIRLLITHYLCKDSFIYTMETVWIIESSKSTCDRP